MIANLGQASDGAMVGIMGSILGRPAADEPDWSLALCKEIYPDFWFPEQDGDNGASAKKICAICPIQDACREYAMARPELEGVWGGLSDHQRHQIRVAQRKQQDDQVAQAA